MTIKQIEETLEEGNSLKTIAQAYSDIASLKVKRIKGETERNRMFFEEISYVYRLIKTLADKKKVKLQKKKKTISLVLTSNYRFHGGINISLLNYFLTTTRRLETDILLINKAAIDFFKSRPSLKNYRSVELKTDIPTPLELKSLVDYLKDYSQILVFYSKLKSLLIQIPEMIDLSSTQIQTQNSSQTDFSFIFEPDLPKLLTFFDSQIITLLLEEAFLESELSRTASRFISMDQAETEANKFIKENEILRSYTKRTQRNNAMLENYTSIRATRQANG